MNTNLMGPGMSIPQSWQPMQPITTVLEPAPLPMLCLEWVVLDIETKGGSALDVEQFIRRTWWPDVRFKDGKLSGWKPETIGERFREAHVNWTEKTALLDSAEIATIQVKTSAGHVCVFHKFGSEVQGPFPFMVSAGNTEKEMLTTFATWLELNCGEGTTLVGWNIKGFDLPRLRLRMARTGVCLPRVLTGLCGVMDLMKEYARNWSVERTEFIAFSDALDALGLENHKKDTDGSMVGALIEAKDYKRLLEYGAQDVEKEAEVFELMIGRGALAR